MSPVQDREQQEFIQEFAQESRELLESLEPDILTMEQVCLDDKVSQSQKDELINSIFRLFHSIKGAAGFLKFKNISKTAHCAESLLDRIRTGELAFVPDYVDVFCSTCDFLREAIDHVDSSFEDESLEKSAQIIQKQIEKELKSSPPKPKKLKIKLKKPPVIEMEEEPVPQVDSDTLNRFLQECGEMVDETETALVALAENKGDPAEHLATAFRSLHSFKGNCGFMGFPDLEKLSHRMESVADCLRDGVCPNSESATEGLLQFIDILREGLVDISKGKSGSLDGLDLFVEMLEDQLPGDRREKPGPTTTSKPLGQILVDDGLVSEDELQEALQKQQQERKEPAPAAVDKLQQQDIRVNLDKLDALINLIGELVIAENMVINNPDLENLELENFGKASLHMSKLVRDLQDMAMTIRMIPVAGLFRRMIRLVHDLSRKSGKKVDLDLKGEETEVDKTVIEVITDPLVHIIRNSIDHGLETAEERKAAGKKESGTLRLTASQEEGSIMIVITDDGRGLDREKLLNTALKRGIITPEDAEKMSDGEVYNLIFAPGFSTASEVTDISGRGVGMDVVRQNLLKIRGKTLIRSKPGQGTTISLRIPLTLAIIEGMMVRTGTAKYIIPILSIRESLKPNASMVTKGPDGQEIVKVRDRLLPVYRLHELHDVTPDSLNLDKGILIILEAHERICLFVDEILGQQQTVIKGLSKYISRQGNVGGVSGCTILGNGEVCLILDVHKLVELTQGSRDAANHAEEGEMN